MHTIWSSLITRHPSLYHSSLIRFERVPSSCPFSMASIFLHSRCLTLGWSWMWWCPCYPPRSAPCPSWAGKQSDTHFEWTLQATYSGKAKRSWICRPASSFQPDWSPPHPSRRAACHWPRTLAWRSFVLFQLAWEVLQRRPWFLN